MGGPLMTDRRGGPRPTPCPKCGAHMPLFDNGGEPPVYAGGLVVRRRRCLPCGALMATIEGGSVQDLIALVKTGILVALGYPTGWTATKVGDDVLIAALEQAKAEVAA